MILSCPRAKLRFIILSLALSCLPFICTPVSAVQLSGAITLANGKCLDADSGGWTANGGRVQVWDCNQNPNQTWHFDSTTSTFKSDSGLYVQWLGQSALDGRSGTERDCCFLGSLS